MFSHADEMLNGSRDTESEVELRRDSLPGAANLAFDRQPAVVADGAGCGNFGAEGRGETLDHREAFRFLNASAHRDDHLRGAEIDCLGRFAEWLAGASADLGSFDGRGEC